MNSFPIHLWEVNSLRKSKALKEIDKLISKIEAEVLEKKRLVWTVPVIRILTFYDEDGNFSEKRLADFISNVRELAHVSIEKVYEDGQSIAKKQDLEVLLSLVMNTIWEAVRNEHYADFSIEEENREDH